MHLTHKNRYVDREVVVGHHKLKYFSELRSRENLCLSSFEIYEAVAPTIKMHESNLCAGEKSSAKEVSQRLARSTKLSFLTVHCGDDVTIGFDMTTNDEYISTKNGDWRLRRLRRLFFDRLVSQKLNDILIEPNAILNI